jgi:hypothetical protein
MTAMRALGPPLRRGMLGTLLGSDELWDEGYVSTGSREIADSSEQIAGSQRGRRQRALGK